MKSSHCSYSTQASKKKHNNFVSHIPQIENNFIHKHYSDDNHIKHVVFGEDYDEVLDGSDEKS